MAARGTAIAPFYSKIDTSDYLSRTFHADPRATLDARRVLAGSPPHGGNLAQEKSSLPEDPYLENVLEVIGSREHGFDFQGIINVHGEGGARDLALVSGGFVGAGPQGVARSAFKGPTFVAGDPQDDLRLHGLVVGLDSFASRLARGSGNSEVEGSPPPEGRRATLVAQVAPGRIFRGLATEDGLEQGTVLYLEIVEVSPDGGVRTP